MKNKIKLIIFILFIAFSFNKLNKLYKVEDKNYRWTQFKKVSTDSIDIVFLGNSHNFASVMPSIIEKFTGLNGYTIGVPSESLITTYYELEEFFKHQSSQYVFIETYTIDVALRHNDDFSYKFINSIPFNQTAIKKIINTNQEKMFSYFPIARKHNEFWKYPLETYQYLFYDYDSVKSNFDYIKQDGFYSIDQMLSNNQLSNAIANQSENQYLLINKEITKYINKIKNLCEKNNAQLIFFTVSEIKYFIDNPPSRINYPQLADQFEIPYIDLRQKPYQIYDYADSNHLSPLGAIKNSVYLAEEMALLFNIPINPIEKIRVQDVFIKQIEIEELSDSSIKITLLNQNKSIDYNQYEFYIDKERIDPTTMPNYSRKNQIIIPKSVKTIDIIISNPNFNFTIKQNLNIEMIQTYE